MKLLFRIMVLVVIVASMTVIFGCTNTNNQNAVVKDEKTISTEKNVVLGLSENIKKVTAAQLNKITKDMTNKEVVNALGNSKDIGSGRYIFRYEYENGEFLDINFGHYDELISDESYVAIQNMLN